MGDVFGCWFSVRGPGRSWMFPSVLAVIAEKARGMPDHTTVGDGFATPSVATCCGNREILSRRCLDDNLPRLDWMLSANPDTSTIYVEVACCRRCGDFATAEVRAQGVQSLGWARTLGKAAQRPGTLDPKSSYGFFRPNAHRRPAGNRVVGSGGRMRRTGWYEGFEGPQPSWQDAGGDAQYRVLQHQRLQQNAHTGAGCEWLQLEGDGGSYVYFAHDVGRPRVIDELTPSVWIKADRANLQLAVRVVLPRTADPAIGPAGGHDSRGPGLHAMWDAGSSCGSAASPPC